MSEIKLAIAGVGNCASSLVQGFFYYKDVDSNNELIPGLMHNVLGGYTVSNVKPVAAFDVDSRKVGRDLSQAIFALPNCTKVFQKDIPEMGVIVQKAPVLDGIAEHMKDYPEDRTFSVSKEKPVDVVKVLKETGAEVLINYVPVGSEDAAKYYAQCALDAGCAFVNCMPVFIASDHKWSEKFQAAGLPVAGDDMKSQLGATIVHRTLVKLFSDRGVRIDRTYQLNTGGNSVTGDQEILLSVNNDIRKVRIGDFIDSCINLYGKRRADGKDIVVMNETSEDIKCFTVDDNFKVVLTRVDALIRHSISEPLYEIETEEGRKIKITGDHNVFVLDDSGTLEEIAVKSLEEGKTYIAVPSRLPAGDREDLKAVSLAPHTDKFFTKASGGFIQVRGHPDVRIPEEFPVSDELLQTVGLWLADGNYDRSGPSYNIELACGDEPECMEMLEKFCGGMNIGYSFGSGGIRVRLLSKSLAKIFRLVLGLTGNTYTKRIPEWAFSLSDRQIALVLRGYLSGDGGVTGKQIRWTSVSEGLIDDIQTLLFRLGICSTKFKEVYAEKRTAYPSAVGYSWHGLISSKNDFENFLLQVGFIQKGKRQSARNAYERLKQEDRHRIPRIGLIKKWRIKSTTWYKLPAVRAHIILSQLDKIKDPLERERIKRICTGDVRFLKVKRISKLEQKENYVYDISTKPFERFVCSNILVHNTDFLNMLARSRLKSKKLSKTRSVQSQLPVPLEEENIHIGPSDYVPWQKDNKVCFIRIEGRKFGNVPLDLELRLSVEDSPNSAGVVIDAVRCAKLALDRNISGPLTSISAYTMKHPPQQYPDPVARQMVEEFIKGERER